MNSVFDSTRVRLLSASLDWKSLPLTLLAWSGTPTFVPTDVTVADFKTHGATDRGTSLAIVNQTVKANGTAQTAPVVIPAVPIGAPITHFTMCITSATHDASELVLFIDECYGLPFEANGLDIVVQPDWAQDRGWWRP